MARRGGARQERQGAPRDNSEPKRRKNPYDPHTKFKARVPTQPSTWGTRAQAETHGPLLLRSCSSHSHPRRRARGLEFGRHRWSPAISACRRPVYQARCRCRRGGRRSTCASGAQLDPSGNHPGSSTPRHVVDGGTACRAMSNRPIRCSPGSSPTHNWPSAAGAIRISVSHDRRIHSSGDNTAS